MNQVDVVLDRLEVGRVDWTTATSLTGRNESWFGRTAAGRPLFVKKIVGTGAEVTNGIERTAAFYRTYTGSAQQKSLRAPTFLGHDTSVQVFEGLDPVRNGEQVALTDEFDVTLGAKAGEAIATVHGLAPATLLEVERRLPQPPQEDLFRGLTLDVFYESSSAQLQAWNLVQSDPVIVGALAPAEARRDDEVRVPSHGDLRLDQFLVAGDQLYLSDWEAFQLADPARDIGSFVGEWLYHAVVRFLSGRSSRAPVPNVVLTPAWRPYAQMRPVVEAFWLGYQRVRPVDADLARRATTFASWHLLERLLIDALARPRLDGLGHTLFRVARMILLSPQRFPSVLGLEGRP